MTGMNWREVITVNPDQRSGKPLVGEDELDSDLHDTEQAPMFERGGIEALLCHEVLLRADILAPEKETEGLLGEIIRRKT
ncbi:MAG: hypothetical protein AMXMBFR81_18360 [Chthonomonas sp.]